MSIVEPRWLRKLGPCFCYNKSTSCA